MDENQILEQIRNADKRDINYFEIPATDRINDSQKSFPPEYFTYREEWNSRLFRNDHGDFPLHVDLESTNRCNLRCSMCQIDFKSMKAGDMDMSLYRKIIGECRNNSLPSIKLNYRGEPTCNSNLVEMVRLAKEAGIIEVQFNTNGISLNENLALSLIEAGLDRIKFSIDGATPEIYEKIRGAKYDMVVTNVKNMVRIRNEKGKTRPIIQVQMVYMQDNKDEVVKYVQLWQDIVNRIGFSKYRSSERYKDPCGILVDQRRVGPPPVTTIPCFQLWQRLLITFDGTVVMCCGDQKIEMPVGNVNQSSIKEIWHSEQLQNCRRLHLQNRSNEINICRSCELNKTDPDTAQKVWKQINAGI